MVFSLARGPAGEFRVMVGLEMVDVIYGGIHRSRSLIVASTFVIDSQPTLTFEQATNNLFGCLLIVARLQAEIN